METADSLGRLRSGPPSQRQVLDLISRPMCRGSRKRMAVTGAVLADRATVRRAVRRVLSSPSSLGRPGAGINRPPIERLSSRLQRHEIRVIYSVLTAQKPLKTAITRPQTAVMRLVILGEAAIRYGSARRLSGTGRVTTEADLAAAAATAPLVRTMHRATAHPARTAHRATAHRATAHRVHIVRHARITRRIIALQAAEDITRVAVVAGTFLAAEVAVRLAVGIPLPVAVAAGVSRPLQRGSQTEQIMSFMICVDMICVDIVRPFVYSSNIIHLSVGSGTRTWDPCR